jgi:hypothetical protein
MDRDSGSLSIAMRPVQGDSQIHSAYNGIPVSLVLLLGLAISCCSWFPSISIQWWKLFLGMLVFSVALWLLQLTGKGRLVCISMLLLIILVCAVFHRQVMGGMGCLGNDLRDQLTRMTGRIYLDFAISKDASALWGIAPVLALSVLLLHLSIQTGKILFFLPIMLPVYAAVLTGFFPVETGSILIGAGSVLLVMKKSDARTGGQGYGGIPTWFLIILFCGTIAAGTGFFFGNTEAKKEKWESLLHDILYNQDTNSMPEGDLQNLPQWRKSDAQALKITMSEPQKLYLRGKIYETYSGTAWLSLSAEKRAEYESLFYWLHQTDFFGQSQIGTASAFITQAPAEELTIENLSACSAHGYYPYALYGNGMLDSGLIGDAMLPEADTLRYYPGSVPEWHTVQQSLASAQARNNVAQYLILEKAYREYITEMDLQLTNESWSVLDRHLGEDKGPMTLSQIREFIRIYLDGALVYDEKVKTLNGSADFLQYTLERSGSGYSVHYATVATLMLRYFGVPARYVEGYYLPAAEATSYLSEQEIILTEEHAHAWAEYYLPGVGFVPFEVTPGYIDDEELELASNLPQSGLTYTGDHLKYAQVEQPELIKEPEQDRFSFSIKKVYLIYLLLILLLVFVLIILVKRKQLQKALAAINAASHRDAIAMRFGYAVKLLSSCTAIEVGGRQKAEELNQEALFSNHEMTYRQRREMDAYAVCVLQECKQKWTILDKLRYRLWDCLY